MTKKCTILDIEDVAEAVSHTLKVDCFLYARMELLGPNYWFYQNGLALQFQILGDHKCIIHIYGVSRDKLRDIRDFIVSAGSWVCDNTSMTCLLVFCREDDMKLRYLIRATGMSKKVYIPSADGDQGEFMYIYTKEDRKRFEEKILCHKQ